MKRLLTLLILSMLLITSVMACGDDDDDNDDAGDDDAGDDDADDDDDTGDDDTLDDDDDTIDDDTLDDDTLDDDTGDDDTTVDALQAGVASAPLNVPIGIPLGGFGLREGPKTPYSVLMGGSEGYRDHPNVKVVALSYEGETIVFAKGSICFPTENLRTAIVERVLERKGVDLDRTLIISGSHTHSGAARYLYVPDILGFIGMDAYDQEMTDRIADGFAEVIIAALDDMAPAKIGFGGRENFDSTFRFASDRRCENGPGDFLENRLWVGRVDNLAGQTIAVLTGYATHGVVFEETTMTGDAPDGVERGIEALYDYPVTALFMQGSAGDATPRRDSSDGHRKLEITEWIGYWVAQIAKEVLDEIELNQTPEMKIITRRYVADRETMGYEDGEFGYYNLYGRFQEFERGAMECGVMAPAMFGSIVDCDNPDTALVDGHLGCAVDLNWPIFDDYIDFLNHSALTVAQIGDTYFYTAPGEVTAELAVDIREAIADAIGVPFENVNTLGYAQNHQFYITQDWDWFQGGFEVEMSLFGPRHGRWLTEEIAAISQELTANYPPTYDDPAPLGYTEEYTPVHVEKSIDLAQVETQPGAAYNRFDTVNFAWHGGHPSVDAFTVQLQKREGDQWVDVTRRNGWAYTDQGWEMKVLLTPDPVYLGHMQRESRDFLYSLAWETNWDDPAGTLRFKVTGQAKVDDDVEPYEVVSQEFTLAAVDSVELSDLSAQAQGGTLTIAVQAAYPPNTEGWRMRSPYAGGANPAIVSYDTATATVTVPGGAKATATLTFDAQTRTLTGTTDVLQAGQPHTITVGASSFDDGFGNGSVSSTLTTVVTP